MLGLQLRPVAGPPLPRGTYSSIRLAASSCSRPTWAYTFSRDNPVGGIVLRPAGNRNGGDPIGVAYLGHTEGRLPPGHLHAVVGVLGQPAEPHGGRLHAELQVEWAIPTEAPDRLAGVEHHIDGALLRVGAFCRQLRDESLNRELYPFSSRSSVFWAAPLLATLRGSQSATIPRASSTSLTSAISASCLFGSKPFSRWPASASWCPCESPADPLWPVSRGQRSSRPAASTRLRFRYLDPRAPNRNSGTRQYEISLFIRPSE